MDATVSKRVYIGTSGWSYKHWKEVFYPPGLPASKWLDFYAKHFDSVEVNSSFYRLPKRETFESWHKKTPQGFIFAPKASRYITHVKKLKGAEGAWERFFNNVLGLGEKLGPILFQFPANWQANLERLGSFLTILPSGYKYAFEFRHESWFTEETYKLLRDGGAALCIADSPLWPTSIVTTASFTYIRFHGGKVLYASEYSEPELKKWAGIIERFLSDNIEVYAYFNNDAFGYAVKNAVQLKELLHRTV